MKVCKKCEHPKDEKEFRNKKISKDGLSYWCIPCENDYQNEYRAKNRSVRHYKSYKQRNKERSKNDHELAAVKEPMLFHPKPYLKEIAPGKFVRVFPKAVSLTESSETKMRHITDRYDNNPLSPAV